MVFIKLLFLIFLLEKDSFFFVLDEIEEFCFIFIFIEVVVVVMDSVKGIFSEVGV